MTDHQSLIYYIKKKLILNIVEYKILDVIYAIDYLIVLFKVSNYLHRHVQCISKVTKRYIVQMKITASYV